MVLGGSKQCLQKQLVDQKTKEALQESIVAVTSRFHNLQLLITNQDVIFNYNLKKILYLLVEIL